MIKSRQIFRGALLGAALTALCAITASAATLGVGTVTGDGLRLRSAASTDSEVLQSVSSGSTLVVLEDVDNGWYKVDCNTIIGYMSGDFLSIASAADVALGHGVVHNTDGQTLNLRQYAGTEYNVLVAIPAGGVVNVIGVYHGWYKVSYGTHTGYVSSDYINLAQDAQGTRKDGNAVPVATGAAAAVATDGSLGAQAVSIAKQYLGRPYVSGAKGPKAFDCSGFLYYVYRQLGYTLSGGSSTQWKTAPGTRIYDMNAMQPGDMFFINNPRYSGGRTATSHAGIYIGNGQFIHASNRGSGVTISSIYEASYGPYFVGAIRLG